MVSGHKQISLHEVRKKQHKTEDARDQGGREEPQPQVGKMEKSASGRT